jgi:hypothetical protein
VSPATGLTDIMTFDSIQLRAALDRVDQLQGEMTQLGFGLQPMRAIKSAATRGKLAALARKRRLQVAVFQLDALELELDVPRHGFALPVELTNFADFDALCASGLKPDIALFRSHQFWKLDGTYNFGHLIEAPRVVPDCVNLVWLWDHHHHPELGGQMAMLADIVLPMHETAVDYLKLFNDYVFSAVPAASAQWGDPRQVEAVFREHAAAERSNRLYGGFVAYEGYQRNQFIRRVMSRLPDHALVLRPPGEVRDIQHFDPATRRQRMIEWMGHKCSLVCALTEDVPIRVFDALLAGQIPLVPYNLNGFDRLVSPADQAALPVLRYDPYDVDSVEMAWVAAVGLYDRLGAAGAARRHRLVLDGHLMKHRVIDVIQTVLNAARIFATR